MITILVTMTFKPELKNEAKKLIMELAEKTRAEDYCISYDAFEDTNDVNTIVLKECFYNNLSILAHKASTHYKEILKGKIENMIQEKSVRFITELTEYHL